MLWQGPSDASEMFSGVGSRVAINPELSGADAQPSEYSLEDDLREADDDDDLQVEDEVRQQRMLFFEYCCYDRSALLIDFCQQVVSPSKDAKFCSHGGKYVNNKRRGGGSSSSNAPSASLIEQLMERQEEAREENAQRFDLLKVHLDEGGAFEPLIQSSSLMYAGCWWILMQLMFAARIAVHS